MNNQPLSTVISGASPCTACSSRCTGLECPRWCEWFADRWDDIRKYAMREYKKPVSRREVFVYEHPDVIRDYINNGVCSRCQRNKVCSTPCPAYWRWWDARMEIARMKVGTVQKVQVSSLYGELRVHEKR